MMASIKAISIKVLKSEYTEATKETDDAVVKVIKQAASRASVDLDVEMRKAALKLSEGTKRLTNIKSLKAFMDSWVIDDRTS